MCSGLQPDLELLSDALRKYFQSNNRNTVYSYDSHLDVPFDVQKLLLNP